MMKKISVILAAMVLSTTVSATAFASEASAVDLEKVRLNTRYSQTTATAAVAEEHTIPILKPVDGKLEGPASVSHQFDIKNSPYYPQMDFYAASPTKTLVKHNQWKTYQQTSERSCAAACALMTLEHFGVTGVSEDALDKEMDIRYYNNPRADGSIGGTTTALAKMFKDRGFQVTSSADTKDENGYSFAAENEFSKYLLDCFKRDAVVMTENIEWGGHWMAIIGYDTMGTESVMDDVLIFADPYDTTDHMQDGYTVKNYIRYFYEWFDHGMMPKDQSVQQYVTVEKTK